MKFEVNEKVFAFTMLLYGQQLFVQLFNEEEDKEWKLIQPILKQLHEGGLLVIPNQNDAPNVEFKKSN